METLECFGGMKVSRWRVRIVTVFSALLGLLWMGCLSWAIVDYYHGEASGVEDLSAQPIEKRPGEFTVVALGDSLTRGTGDETGKGYVGTVTEELEKKFDHPITVQNLGIKGLVSAQLAEQVQEREVERQLQRADAILVTIGGNDLFQKGETLLNLDSTTISKLQKNYLVHLDEILSTIRQNNSSAQLFMLGLYNPFIELDENGEMNAIVRQWNNETAEVLAKYEDMVFVPTFDLFQLSVNEYLYSDKFHPNSAGYRLMAERIAPLIEWEAKDDE